MCHFLNELFDRPITQRNHRNIFGLIERLKITKLQKMKERKKMKKEKKLKWKLFEVKNIEDIPMMIDLDEGERGKKKQRGFYRIKKK